MSHPRLQYTGSLRIHRVLYYLCQYLSNTHIIDNTVHDGYATSPYTAIGGGTITASGNTDVSKHLQEMNGCSSSSVCSRQDIQLIDTFVRIKVF